MLDNGLFQFHNAQRSHTRPTIGLVFTNETKSLMVDQWMGVLDEAREHVRLGAIQDPTHVVDPVDEHPAIVALPARRW